MTAAILADRLEKHIARVPESGCWVWVGAVNKYGYGRVFVGGKNKHAHRVTFELHRGKIPDGLVLDHLCRVRCCVNPSHLEPVTLQENIARGDHTNKAWKSKLTHCKHGHELSNDNVYLRVKRGKTERVCKTCHRRYRNGGQS